MILYRWRQDTLQINNDDRIVDILFPENLNCAPVFSKDKRYIAVCGINRIYVYDALNNTIMESPGKLKNLVFEVRLDECNRVYYIEGNRIGRWDFNTNKMEPLYHMNRAIHGPENLGVCPNGRYISFTKYRSSSEYLFLYNVETGECKDLKFSLLHYIWIDETHIAWTLCGGLKIFDTETGKNTTLIRDHKALLKKSKKEDASLLEQFRLKDDVMADLDLLGIKGDKLYFSLYLLSFESETKHMKSIDHMGIWSVSIDGANPEYCYAMPKKFLQAIHKGFNEDESIYWEEPRSVKIFDGTRIEKVKEQWKPVVNYMKRNR